VKGSLVVSEPIEEPEKGDGGGTSNVDVAQNEMLQFDKRSEEWAGRRFLFARNSLRHVFGPPQNGDKDRREKRGPFLIGLGQTVKNGVPGLALQLAAVQFESPKGWELA
jgi:hypothetical protein